MHAISYFNLINAGACTIAVLAARGIVYTMAFFYVLYKTQKFACWRPAENLQLGDCKNSAFGALELSLQIQLHLELRIVALGFRFRDRKD